jgi:hypothetical protein
VTIVLVQELCAMLKRGSEGRCLDGAAILQQFLDAHPEVDPIEARRTALLVGRTPFPSIDGNPPVFRDRPFYDARYWRGRDGSSA